MIVASMCLWKVCGGEEEQVEEKLRRKSGNEREKKKEGSAQVYTPPHTHVIHGM